MRFVAIALILLSLPLFVALLNQHRARRDWALFALGAMLFLVGTLQVDAALVTWRLWQGISRGIFISPIDTLSLALIMTRSGRRSPVHLWWVMPIYIAPSLLSLTVSYMPMATVFISMQILRVAIMVYALAGELHRPAALRSLFGGIATGLIIQSGFVIEQKLSGMVQAKGTADHQNILGLMVEMAVIPLMALVLEGERRKLAYAGVVAALVVVAGGGSRATMGFTAAGIATVMLLSLLRKVTARKTKFLGLSVLASLLIVPLGAATLMDRFDNRSITAEDAERPAFERAARAMAADHPFGVGANNYVMVANEQGYSQRAGVSWGGGNLAAPVHNAYLLTRAETGWFGEFVMLVVLFVPIVAGLRIGFSDRQRPVIGMALGCATAAMVAALHSNYEYAWHLESVQRLFFVNLAVLSACLAIRQRLRRQQGPRLRGETAPPRARVGQPDRTNRLRKPAS